MTSPTESEQRLARDLLSTALRATVPLALDELRGLDPDRVRHLQREVVDALCAHGDDLLYGGKHCASTFTALARALAVLAYAPGGVTAFGSHWCTDHTLCESAR